jgi:nicotinate-nucleotide pyrophosphorylase (carboxylating)
LPISNYLLFFEVQTTVNMSPQEFEQKLQHLVTEALAEDIGDGDHSTLSCIPADARGKAVLKIKQEGMLAGVQVASHIFEMAEPGAQLQITKHDGETMEPGQTAFQVEATIHTILTCERLVLNCMQRMSGIATLTNTYVKRLQGCKTRILDTRKTTPNFRLLEKEAVRIGGAVNHRFGLYDMIMLKDNHIDFAGSIEKAIEQAWRYANEVKPGLKIEVETRSLNDVKRVAACGRGKVFRVMVDNFAPADIKSALEILGPDFETEASGGITLNNIEEYAATGVDYVSSGALIHQAQSLDLSLKAVIG